MEILLTDICKATFDNGALFKGAEANCCTDKTGAARRDGYIIIIILIVDGS